MGTTTSEITGIPSHWKRYLLRVRQPYLPQREPSRHATGNEDYKVNGFGKIGGRVIRKSVESA